MAVRSRGLRVAVLATLVAAVAGCGKQKVQLSMQTPRDDQTVRSSKLDVRGKVEPATAEVRVNDKPVRTRDGVFTVTVRLHRGRNRVNVAATSSGRTSDIRDFIVRRARTRAELAAVARRKREARRAASAAARAAVYGKSVAGRYPDLVRRYYLASCKVQSTAKVCGCTLRYLEAHVSLEELGRAERTLVAGGTVPGFVADAIKACGPAAA